MALIPPQRFRVEQLRVPLASAGRISSDHFCLFFQNVTFLIFYDCFRFHEHGTIWDNMGQNSSNNFSSETIQQIQFKKFLHTLVEGLYQNCDFLSGNYQRCPPSTVR